MRMETPEKRTPARLEVGGGVVPADEALCRWKAELFVQDSHGGPASFGFVCVRGGERERKRDED